MSQTGPTIPSAAAAKSTETLSQFLARILDQLSLSAWLPSAALVFLGGLTFSLLGVLNSPDAPDGSAAKLGRAVVQLADAGLGGAILAVSAVIVLTMLTQAFAFEAIRVLEGYWGTTRAIERIADRRCRRHAQVRADLDIRRRKAIDAAWASAEPAIIAKEARRRSEGKAARMTPDMIDYLRSAVTGAPSIATVNDRSQALIALSTKWEVHAAPELIRRRDNLAKRLRDYPEPGRESPTRLGNIMRRHEDRTGERQLEGFVQEVFDQLPFSMQVDHDDQRSRLDLYCSMVFVLLFAGGLAGAVLWTHPGYAAGALAACAIGSIVSYRAAMASARAYGGVLISISNHVRRERQKAATPATSPTAANSSAQESA